MAKPTPDYEEHPVTSRVEALLRFAEVGRRAKRETDTSLPAALNHPLLVFRDKWMVAFGKKAEADAAEREAEASRNELEGKVTEAIQTYLTSHSYNHRALEALDQFQANFGRVYEATKTLSTDDVLTALTRIENDIRNPEQYKSLDAYVSTLPVSKDVRSLFLPPQEKKSRKYAPIVIAFLAGATLMRGCDYLVDRQIKKYDSFKTPTVAINAPAPTVIHAGPTRANVREYLEDHPDLLSAMCPDCPEPPKCPDCPKLPILPVVPSSTLLQSAQPSSTLSQGPKPSSTVQGSSDGWINEDLKTRRSRLGE